MPFEKYVIGTGPLLEWAMVNWAEVEPNETLHAIDIGQDGDYKFDLSALNNLSPSNATAFVAWGSQFLNFRRMELMGEFKNRGFRLPPLVCRGAVVSATAKLGENCAIGPLSVIGAGCQIGFNSFIGSAAVIGHTVRVGASAWIEDGVQIAAGTTIGAHATIGRGIHIGPNIHVGKHCIVDIPGHYRTSIAAGSHYLQAFSKPVFILNI